MDATETERKDTGLQKGDAAKIARIHRVSRHHVLEVARGNRQGRESLVRTIEKYRERNACQQAEPQHSSAA